MFSFDVFNRPEPLTIFLCKPDDTIVCELNGIDNTTASLQITLNNQAELSFDYNRYINTDGAYVESNGWESIDVDMQLLVENIGFFRMKYPPRTWDEDGERKSITAFSVDCELEDKDLVRFKINTGESDSLEYLVTYDDDETEELLNAYTGLPYDYIMFDNTYPAQLEELLNKYEDGSTITDEESIEEISSYCSTIPRLMRKITSTTTVDEYGIETTETELTEYVEYTYETVLDTDGITYTNDTITSIYLFDGFNARISELITFYTKYHDQLSLIPLAIENCSCNWTVGEIDSSLANKKYQFDIDGENIYSFLTNTIAQTCECVFIFDLFNRVINVSLIENIGVDSGVILDKENLLTSVTVSCDADDIYTRYNVSGGNDIDLTYVNFGRTRIADLSWFMNTRDENGKRIYVSDELAEKYSQYEADVEAAREYYITYTKEYNQSLTDINELKYRVPNDSLQEDWDTYTTSDLEDQLTNYNNLLVTLITLYKEDYGANGMNDDGSVKESYIKQTMYWYDYYAYTYTIEQIEAAIVARANDSSYADIDDETTLELINAYKTEWSLYGIVELQNKIAAYTNSINVLLDAESVIVDDDGVAVAWDSLTDEQQAEYGELEVEYQYDAYVELYNYRASAQEYLDGLLLELEDMEAEQAEAQSARTAIAALVMVEDYDRDALGELVPLEDSSISGTFTDDEIKAINRMYKDKNYSNEYILTTSLDTTVTTVDVEYELLEDAREQLSIEAQPQVGFSVDVDNLLAMPEFKDYKFEVGNYVTVRYYDDYYVTLRLYSMTFNPCYPEDTLEISFTNFIKSNAERSDVSYILGQSTGGGSSSSSSSGGGSGTFGDSDDIDVTISNTMLSKLLNTEMFGTRVSNIILDTIKVNQITAKYAKFDGLAKGTTVIDGKCIQTGCIISSNYNGTIHKTNLDEDGNETDLTVVTYKLDNTEGSIWDAETGEFSLAGGKLKYTIDDDGDATLYIDGTLTWNNVYTDDGQSIADYLNSIGSSNNTLTYDAASKTLQYGGTELTGYYVTSPNLIGGTLFIGTSNGIHFSVDSAGNLYANSAEIEGKITASSGYIGNWVITDTGLYNGTSSMTSNIAGTYIGTDGIRQYNSSSSYVTIQDGILTAMGAVIQGKITAYSGIIGGFTIGSTYIRNGSITSATNTSVAGVYVGTDGFNVSGGTTATTAYFTKSTVNIGGKLTWNGSVLSVDGVLMANAGSEIGGWTIGSNSIYRAGDNTICYLSGVGSSSDNFLAVTDTSGSACFVVYQSGKMYCQYESVQYKITVSDGVEIWDDDEGGNIKIIAPPDYGIVYQADAYDGNLRIFSCGADDESTVKGSIVLSSSGNLTVSGAVKGTSWTATSDERKKNIVELDSRYDALFMGIKPIPFSWKDSSDNRIHLGIGAQSTIQTLINCGFGETELFLVQYDDKNDSYGVAYNELEILTLYMTQKNVNEIEELKAKIADLQEQLAALQA